MTPQNQEVELFYAFADEALKKCYDRGFEAAYMPQLVDARLEGKAPWDRSITALSIKATGQTRQKNKVVVYAHLPNLLCIPKYLEMARNQKVRDSIGTNATRFPQTEFQSLVDRDGQTDEQGNRLVWIIDYDLLNKAKSGRIQIEEALDHPQTIPFLCGEERAQRYLAEHQRLRKIRVPRINQWSTESDIRQAKNIEQTIGVVHRQMHCSDFNKDSPSARLLLLGDINNIYDDDNGLVGDNGVYSFQTFFGHHQTSENDKKTREIMTAKVDEFLERLEKTLENAFVKLYQQ